MCIVKTLFCELHQFSFEGESRGGIWIVNSRGSWTESCWFGQRWSTRASATKVGNNKKIDKVRRWTPLDIGEHTQSVLIHLYVFVSLNQKPRQRIYRVWLQSIAVVVSNSPLIDGIDMRLWRMLRHTNDVSEWSWYPSIFVFIFRRPDTSFSWFRNPLKALKYTVCRLYRKKIVVTLVVLVLVAMAVAAIYALPGYSVKKLLHA